ncbi:hypothetical protein BGW38_002473, partial [Lunasporangiospora selenospora]
RKTFKNSKRTIKRSKRMIKKLRRRSLSSLQQQRKTEAWMTLRVHCPSVAIRILPC